MPLTGTKEMFEKAYKGGYAVGAFNVNNMEIIQGIVEAADEERAPLILQVSAGARKYARHEYLIKLVEAALLTTDLPVVLHLDHGDGFEICKSCIDGGFSSIMIDGSQFPFEENVRVTKEVVDYAHKVGVPVEAELGKLAGIEDAVKSKESVFTDPDEAVKFVEMTGCDSLAISVGTSHGAYKFKEEPQLDFERLEIITEKLPGYPLVLHGASSVLPGLVKMANEYGAELPGAKGVPEEMIKRAVALGVCKVNIDTDLRLAMTATIRKYMAENPVEFDPRKYLGPARGAIKEVVRHKLKDVLGCSNKV
jgi:fructose-bisphosphate aldolase, class II